MPMGQCHLCGKISVRLHPALLWGWKCVRGLGLVQKKRKSPSLTWRRSRFLKYPSSMCKGKLSPSPSSSLGVTLGPRRAAFKRRRVFCNDSVANYPTILWPPSFDQFYISLWAVVVTSAPELLPKVEPQSQGIVVWERETCALCSACRAAAALLIKNLCPVYLCAFECCFVFNEIFR